MEKIFFLFAAINLSLILCSDIISLELLYNINISKNDNISFILSNLGNTYLYSYIKIGEPEYSLKTNISVTTPHFFIGSNLEPKSIINSLDLYDIYKSKTFKNISKLNQYYVQSVEDISAKEKFIINIYNSDNKNNKNQIINDMDFVLGVRNSFQTKHNYSEVYFITIGLQLYSTSKYIQEKQFNFISISKEKEIISNYNWFIYYEKISLKDDYKLYNVDDLIKNKKNLWIGGYPHEYASKYYSKGQLFSVYSNYFLWIIEFKCVYFYRNNTKFNTGMIKQEIYHNKARLDFNNFFIYAPSLYLSMIKNEFFNIYHARNICHYYTDNNMESIYCDKSEDFNVANLKHLPILYFEHNEFNYTFEFSYKDLFAEKDNKYIFLIAVKTLDVDDWFFGDIFLRKYQLVFNQDSKSISFYNINIKIDDINNEENNKKTIIINKSLTMKYIVLIIFSCFMVFIGIGFIIGYLIYKDYKNKKKKRANELEDDYEYVSDKLNKNIIN